jgi:hypothetical protein
MGLLKNRPAAYVVGGVSRLGIWFGRLGYVFSGLGAAFGVITANPC